MAKFRLTIPHLFVVCCTGVLGLVFAGTLCNLTAQETPLKKVDPGQKAVVLKDVNGPDGEELLGAIGSRGLDPWPGKFRELLQRPCDFKGFDDPKTTLRDVLTQLEKDHGIPFEFNDSSHEDSVAPMVVEANPLVAAEKPIPTMKDVNLAVILRTMLDRIPTRCSYILRGRRVVIFPYDRIRTELAIADTGIPRPLVWGTFEKKRIVNLLADVVETTGFNLVVDPRLLSEPKAGDSRERLLTRVTLVFNNVPVDTAVITLANMAGVDMVQTDNVFFITTVENAEKRRERQKPLNPSPSGAMMGLQGGLGLGGGIWGMAGGQGGVMGVAGGGKGGGGFNGNNGL